MTVEVLQFDYDNYVCQSQNKFDKLVYDSDN